MKYKKISNLYYVHNNPKFGKKFEWQKVEAFPVKIRGLAKYDLFIHRALVMKPTLKIAEKNILTLSEGKTGLSVVFNEDSISELINKSYNSIKDHDFDKMIKEAIKEHGLSPRYKERGDETR